MCMLYVYVCINTCIHRCREGYKEDRGTCIKDPKAPGTKAPGSPAGPTSQSSGKRGTDSSYTAGGAKGRKPGKPAEDPFDAMQGLGQYAQGRKEQVKQAEDPFDAYPTQRGQMAPGKKEAVRDPFEAYHAKCKSMFGEHAVFNGVDSCACEDGYEESNGSCVPVGKPAAATGHSAGVKAGAKGRGGVAGKYDAQCEERYGDGVEWDGAEGCRLVFSCVYICVYVYMYMRIYIYIYIYIYV
jgi:hypothetical protein